MGAGAPRSSSDGACVAAQLTLMVTCPITFVRRWPMSSIRVDPVAQVQVVVVISPCFVSVQVLLSPVGVGASVPGGPCGPAGPCGPCGGSGGAVPAPERLTLSGLESELLMSLTDALAAPTAIGR